jgi:hypothetical protein
MAVHVAGFIADSVVGVGYGKVVVREFPRVDA